MRTPEQIAATYPCPPHDGRTKRQLPTANQALGRFRRDSWKVCAVNHQKGETVFDVLKPNGQVKTVRTRG